MGVQGGPKTNTTGLILSVDAANVKSFRGEPTTNLLPNLSSWGGYVVTPTIVTVTDGPPYTLGKPKQVLQMVTSGALAGGGNYGGANAPNIDLLVSQSQSVAVSFWARSLSGNTMQLNFSHQNGAGDNSNLAFSVTNLGSEWRFLQNTASLNLTKSQFYFWNQNIRGGTFQITDFQLENKAYPTPYVSGTRGSGSAQGGGWVDLTYGDNSGVLTNGPTFNSGSGGNIVFDGVNDVIITPVLPQQLLTTGFTVSVIVKYNANTTNDNVIRWGGPGAFNAGTSNSWELRFRGAAGAVEFAPGRLVGAEAAPRRISYTPSPSLNGRIVALDITYIPDGIGTIYENAILRSTQDYTGAGTSTVTNELRIGQGTDTYFPGNIYNVKIYNRVLSAQEILENFNAVRSRFGI